MAPDPDEAALLAAWRGGDRDAGQTLFRRHFAALHRFFATKTGDADASDLAQRTFLAAVAAKDRLRPDTRLRAYLFAIARNELMMMLRTRGRRGVDVELGESCAEMLLPSPSSVLVRDETESLVVSALRRIPLDLQIILELHYWEEMSTEELAGVLDVPRGTIKSRLWRAREAAREELAKLIEDPVLRATSIQHFEEWVGRLRDRLAPPPP